jgi:hypothetical protein
MSLQTIGIGAEANDGTGDPLRTAFNKCNENFASLQGTMEILGAGDHTINSPGNYALAADIGTLNVTADNVHVLGSGRSVAKMLNQGEGNTFLLATFGNRSTANPATSNPSATGIESLDDYLVWSEKPANFSACNFVGDGSTGKAGLILGKNGSAYGSTTHADVTQPARTLLGCRFVNCGAGLVMLPFMEYYTILGCNFSYNGTGACVLAGNTNIIGSSVVYNREGIRWSYPKAGGARTYAWSGELTAPSTYANAAAANAFHGRLSDCLINHNTFGLITFETIVSDPKIYGLRASACEFQANATADVYASHIERLELHGCYCRGTVSPVLSSSRIFAYNTEIGTVTPVSGGVLHRNPVQELSADPSDPAEGHHSVWQSDGSGTGSDGDILAKVTAGGVTKTATLVDFSGL